MTTAFDHPLARALRDAAHGRFPPTDGKAEVGPAPPGPCDSVAFFSDHLVVAADVDQDWVREQYERLLNRPPHDPTGGLSGFFSAFSERLGNPPTMAVLLSVAPYRPAFLPGKIEPGGEVDAEWTAYRHDIRTFQYSSAAVEGTIAIGRGPAERWEVQLLIRRAEERGGNAARQMLTAAKTLVPDCGLLFGPTPLHDLQVLRRGLRAEFLPICTEMFFLTRPHESGTGGEWAAPKPPTESVR
jgi:hypothetical protein